jgi:iron(III) transport system substrate-binding protein
MKKSLCLAVVLILFGFTVSCEKKESNEVLMYTSSEDYRIEHFRKRFAEQFPQYKVIIHFYTTGNLGAKLKAEGTDTDCDIIGELESAYLEGILDSLADLSSYDSSVFLDELVPAHKKYMPLIRNTGCIGINENFMAERNLPVPASYQDLLKPEYKGVLSMPNPKISGTAYFFLKNLVNVWGEDAAFAYFDRFAENVLQFASSGAGPVNALIQGEVGIALGMTSQVVNAINTRGAPLKPIFFEEGSPYSVYGIGIIKGKETRQAVRDVFEFYLYTLNREDKELFVPEQVFKIQETTIPNYPRNVKVADMRGIESLSERDRLLEKWNY